MDAGIFYSYFCAMLEEWGLMGMCVICFVSATIIPFPSEAAFLYCLHEGYSVYLVFLCAIVFNSLGGATNYALGYYGRKISKKPYLRAELLVNRYGYFAAFFSWVPIIGDPLMIVFGVYRTKLFPTMLFMTLGKAGRYVVYYLGYLTLV